MNWPTVRLGTVVETLVPQRDKPIDLTGDIPWVRIEDFAGQYISSSKSGQGVTAAQVRSMNLRIFPKGTVLCSCSCTMGATAIAAESITSNQTFIGLVPSAEIDSRFLYYLMGSMREELQSKAAGAIQQYLSRDDFRSLRIKLPPLAEQRRIADFLDAATLHLDALRSAQARTRSLVLERREALVMAEVTGAQARQFRASDVRWMEKIPADWQSARVGLLARMGSGHTPSRSHPEWWTDCDIPWITTGEVSQVRDDRREVITETREKISRLGLANSAAELHPAGTVVLCRTASAGYSAVMGIDMATSQDFVTWTCGPRLDPFYLLWCLRAMRQDLLGRLAMGSTHKTIYVPDLQMLKIPLPDVPEQQQIVAVIRRRNAEADRLVDAIDRQLVLLAERRQALITAAVTGQIDVTTARGVEVA
jgi:type I restriction enzyme S subunit